MAEDCLFCKVINGEVPSTEVYSDDDLYAFRDINPGAPTHILIVPRKHIARISDAKNEDQALLGKMMLKANDIARFQGLVEDGFRYVINCNSYGGQSVYHIHMHILGGRPLSWPPG